MKFVRRAREIAPLRQVTPIHEADGVGDNAHVSEMRRPINQAGQQVHVLECRWPRMCQFFECRRVVARIREDSLVVIDQTIRNGTRRQE